MSAPRIDTFHRTIDAVIERLEELRPEVADVHDLAYNRHRAAQEQRTSGGSRDYALDTHGDLVARKLYIDVAANVIGLARGAEKALLALRRHMNQDTDRVLRRDGSADVTPAEFEQARWARARRAARGEHHPHAVVAQPERKPFRDPVAELEHLRSAVARMAGRFEAEHSDCRTDEGKRKPKRYDRSLLSQAQRDAWDRCFLAEVDKSAAS